ncbi:hypothetical protein ACJDU8_01010 [Clostridium sp. WILCCON 0269]|uniref:Preprotein translocase subunit SecB n=1 Tax=Candidatus Clostridium eludens TaxID=3381663 RepID=A0ABW8SE85_9CLOT
MSKSVNNVFKVEGLNLKDLEVHSYFDEIKKEKMVLSLKLGIDIDENKIKKKYYKSYKIKFTLDILCGGKEDEKESFKESFIEINAIYDMNLVQIDKEYAFQVNDDKKLKGFVQMVVWPYFREITSNVTSRMGIPSIEIPIR